ncbi:MAG: phosphatase PAP2 family protein, partial [Bacteroidia bacterium]|nr:phosphatase PAP2 family protein [Bacteroidia bacterium]
ENKKWYKHPVISIGAVPAVFIGYGVSVIGKNKVFTSSYEVREWRNKNYGGFRTHVDDALWAVPAAAPMTMRLCGMKTKNNFQGQLIRYSLSTLLANLIIQPLKYSTKILRPDGSTANSFPSGHTTAAFVSAEFMHQELGKHGWGYSVAAYSVATSVGTMRILNNRHWFSDVLVGAGIGMLSTKLVYFICDKVEKRRKRHNRIDLKMTPP